MQQILYSFLFFIYFQNSCILEECKKMKELVGFRILEYRDHTNIIYWYINQLIIHEKKKIIKRRMKKKKEINTVYSSSISFKNQHPKNKFSYKSDCVYNLHISVIVFLLHIIISNKVIELLYSQEQIFLISQYHAQFAYNSFII